MSKTLGGFLFVKDGVKYDYCFEETIMCLLQFCDKVSCLVIEGEDETVERVKNIEILNPEKLLITILPESQWEETKGLGKLKLSYFQNIAASFLDTDYQFLLQADEIVHEDSYKYIRQAMEWGIDGFLCTRINLWKSPYLQLNVPQERKPCSTQVIRLTKKGYVTYDDGENIDCLSVPDLLPFIRIYHVGFVRKREVMKSKVSNMQKVVFEMENHDNKLDLEEIFNPDLWFTPEIDLEPIKEPLPALIQRWAAERS